MPELIAYAKANPGKLTYGSSGVGSVFHVMGELLNHSAGIETRHVPYRGVALAIQDVIAGHIPMMFISVSSAARRVAGRQGQGCSPCSSRNATRKCPTFPR